MKKLSFILFIILALSFTNTAKGQYKSIFGDDYTEWYISFEALGTDPCIIMPAIVTEEIEIDGHIYKYLNGLCYIREDTIAGRLWRRLIGSDTEFLIMDLSMSVGDTLFFDTSHPQGIYSLGCNYTVADSIFYDEYGRKNIITSCKTNSCIISYFLNESIHLRFIEGVGPNLGIMYGDVVNSNYSYLMCGFKDGVQHFANLELNGVCDTIIGVGINNNQNNLNFDIYPNPANKTLSLKMDEYTSGNIYIYNTAGVVLKNHKFNNSNFIEIDIENLPEGLYLIKVIDDANNTQVLEKFIKLNKQ